MPFTAEDVAQVAAIVAQTMTQLQTQNAPVGHDKRVPHVDDRHFRKSFVFGGDYWKDWSFQFRSAMRASNPKAYGMLTWSKKEETEIEDFINFEEVSEEQAEHLSGQWFIIVSTIVKFETSQLLHTCGYNGAETWRKWSKR